MVDSCNVCGDNKASLEDPLVYCNGGNCNVVVHTGCYGIFRKPERSWYCDKCIFYGGLSATNVRCQFCPFDHGALKNTKKGWAHVVCALYIPEGHFEKFKQSCYICAESKSCSHLAKIGACILCNTTGCGRYFHVTCAQRNGFLCEESGDKNDVINYVGYCSMHSKFGKNNAPTVSIAEPKKSRQKATGQPIDSDEPAAKRKRIENEGHFTGLPLLSVLVIRKLSSGPANFVLLMARALFKDLDKLLAKSFYEQDPLKIAFIRKCLINHFPSEAGNEQTWKKICNGVDKHVKRFTQLLLNRRLYRLWWNERVYEADSLEKVKILCSGMKALHFDNEEEMEDELSQFVPKTNTEEDTAVVSKRKFPKMNNEYIVDNSTDGSLPLISKYTASIIQQLCSCQEHFVLLISRAIFTDFRQFLVVPFRQQYPLKLSFIKKCLIKRFSSNSVSEYWWNIFCNYMDEHVKDLKKLLLRKGRTWWNGRVYGIADLMEFDKQCLSVTHLDTSKVQTRKLTAKDGNDQSSREEEKVKEVQEQNVELTKERNQLLPRNRKSQTDPSTPVNTALKKTMVENQKRKLDGSDNEIKLLTEKCEEMAKRNSELEQKSIELVQKSKELVQKSNEIEQKSHELLEKSQELEQINNALIEKNNELEQKSNEWQKKSDVLDQKSQELEQKSNEWQKKSYVLDQKSQELEQKSNEWQKKSYVLDQKSQELEQKSKEMEQKSLELEQKNNQLKLKANLVQMNNCTAMVTHLVDREETVANLRLKMAELETKNDSLQRIINQLQNAHSSQHSNSSSIATCGNELSTNSNEPSNVKHELDVLYSSLVIKTE